MESIEEFIEDQETYRDSIATVDESGNRIWLYPRKPKGWFHNRRVVVAIILIGAFFLMPFIWVEGHPFFLFNIFERKFIILGNVFMPQDFHLVALSAITFFVFVILFTVLFGRIWCGWACPQTVFMEMIFRKIEYWIEGDANQQRKLNAQPWNSEKIFKKIAKQGLFVLFSLLIAHTVMAYLIGIDQVLEVISQPPQNNLAGFIGLGVFTFLFWGVFTYMREQACIAVCPYGRLQGVLLGKDSVVISYDFERGEPRGKIRKKKNESEGSKFLMPKGDCIDCSLCVQVCPTGIDIRNGTQLECVNCTACIDACDMVMDKIDKPKGLIRYASYTNIVKGTKFELTPRVLAYSFVLVALLTLDGYLLTSRADLEATILRVPGTLYQELDNKDIRNIINIP
ncbi:MAG: cytochrome c oxidase accessory protein CcoG, partial [Bacteroidota bacterium]